jgi:H+/Cl- antiporter ClcA
MRDRWRRMTPEKQGFIIWTAFAAFWFGALLVGGLIANVGGPDGTPQYTEGEPEGIGWPWFLISGVLLGLFVGLAGYAIMRIFRQRGVKFEDLDREEQARREEAGKLLHDL